MTRLMIPLSIAMCLVGQTATAKHRLTDPVKIARECKPELERFCAKVRPGSQRTIKCLKQNAADLSFTCQDALKAAE